MHSLHLFYPENDLALARDLDNYTPPPAASRLRKSGETLALWYGDDGDKVFTQGINSQWYRGIKERFGLRTELYDGNPPYAGHGAISFAPSIGGVLRALAVLNSFDV